MTSKIEESSFLSFFSVLVDPGKKRNQLYCLSDILSTAVFGVLCGYENWEEVSMWTEANLSWLNSLGICLNGAPSHDTYSRFFRFLDPEVFQKCFIQWTQSLVGKIQGVIAIDGKTLRGSGEDSSYLDAIHMVSAFADENEIVLGQLKTKGKGKGLEGIKQIIELLDIEGATVSIDAAGCQKEVAQLIRDKKGDYLLALKRNQGNLFKEADNFFQQVLLMDEKDWEKECGCDYFIAEEKSRNRKEKREVWSTRNLEWLPQREDWIDLKSLVCVRSTRTVKEETSTELRFFISSKEADSEVFAKDIRSHWSIENKLHYVLDVAYNEDRCQVRKDHGAENFSTIRRLTQNLIKLEKSNSWSINKKRTYASLNPDYRLKLLGSAMSA